MTGTVTCLGLLAIRGVDRGPRTAMVLVGISGSARSHQLAALAQSSPRWRCTHPRGTHPCVELAQLPFERACSGSPKVRPSRSVAARPGGLQTQHHLSSCLGTCGSARGPNPELRWGTAACSLRPQGSCLSNANAGSRLLPDSASKLRLLLHPGLRDDEVHLPRLATVIGECLLESA
jgi:hypothetical protein